MLLWVVIALCFAWVLTLLRWVAWSSGAEDADPEMQGIIELADWMRSQGAFIHHCLVAKRCPPYGGRCMGAACDLRAGELLISVPAGLQLLPNAGGGEPLCPSLEAELRRQAEFHFKEEDVLLLLRLLRERARGPAGPFGRYFRTLPLEFPSVLWDEQEQKRCLANTPGESRVRRRFTRDREQAALLQTCAEVSADDCRWAKLIVATRAFSGMHERRREWQALVPFADIFNDAIEPSATWWRNGSTGDFRVAALVDVPRGREVLISYGMKNNEKLLTRYGFVHFDSPHDAATIYLRESDASGPPPSLILSLGLQEPSSLKSALRPLGVLRALAVNSDTVQGDPARREVAVLATVQDRCEAAAKSWRDEPAVSAGNQWLCSGYRSGLVSLADACAAFADLAAADLEQRHSSRSLNGSSGRLAQGLLTAWREVYSTLDGNPP